MACNGRNLAACKCRPGVAKGLRQVVQEKLHSGIVPFKELTCYHFSLFIHF